MSTANVTEGALHPPHGMLTHRSSVTTQTQPIVAVITPQELLSLGREQAASKCLV